MKLTVLSPERRLVTDLDIEWVSLPGSEGEIQILEGHAPMIGTLHTGVFTYRAQGQDSTGVISSGFFEVMGDSVVVLAETLELKGEIDVARARKSQGDAEELLKSAELDEHSFKLYNLKLQKALVRQQFASSHHAQD